MWPLHPGSDNQYKQVFPVFIIGCLDGSETQWLRSLVKGLIETTHFLLSVEFSQV